MLPQPKGFGHPKTVDLREILNAIFYVQRTGGQWKVANGKCCPTICRRIVRLTAQDLRSKLPECCI